MRLRTVIVVTMLLFAVTSCGSSQVAARPVLLLGDSILFSAEQPVGAALQQAGWKPAVAAVGGTRIESWPLFSAKLVAQDHPAIAVVELGTNNCTLGGGCVALQGQIDSLMKTLDPVKVVLWLNVQQDVPLTQNAKFVNAQIALAAKRWPKMKIVDFNGDFANRPGLNLPDQVHLTPKGITALTDLIVHTLEPYRLPS